MKKIITTLLLLIAVAGLYAQPAGWSYNQAITVNNPNASSVTGYQLMLTVNTQSLIAAGRMNANGSDLRFGGDCAGSTLFNYWIESGINTVNTTVWVKIPFMAANSSTVIYMYFGNPTAPSASAVQGTFRGPNSATDSVSGGTSGGLLVCQRGFRFAPNQNVLVTHFGKNEPSGTTRYVTLFNFGTQAILSQTQVAGPSSTYSYGPISSPLWLTQGTQYVLQIFGTASDGYFYQSNSQIGQHLTYFDMQYSNGGTQNTFPNSTLAGYHYGYGDFLYYICTTLAITPSYTIQPNNISVTAPLSPVCAGSTVTLTTNASGSFTWSNGSTSNTIVITPNTAGTYTVFQNGTGPCNVAAIANLSVNVGVPVMTVTQSTTNICPGNTLMITASGALSYNWTGGITNGVAFSPPGSAVYTVTGTNACGASTATAGISVTPLPVNASVSPTLICSGGAATLSVTGATNYTWTPGNLTGSTAAVSASAATIYTVYGTTSVCAGSTTISLAVNPVPTISTLSFTNVCEGQSYTMTASGGNSYTWQPGNLVGSSVVVTPTLSQLYSVTGINNFNCTGTANQAVQVISLPPVNLATNKSQICPGTSATLTATGGSNYAWSAAGSGSTIVVSPVISTTYSVTGTGNAGCSKTATVSVNVFTVPLTVSPSTNICTGNTITLVASGASGYTWSTGNTGPSTNVSPTSNTVYIVSAIVNSLGLPCPASRTITVNVDPLPAVTATVNRTQVCKNENFTVTAAGAQSYTWSTFQTVASFSVKATQSAYNYTVNGTSTSGCQNSATVAVKVNACTAIEEMVRSRGLAIFPNPAGSFINILTDEDVTLELSNENGQLLRTVKVTGGENLRFDTSELARGIYFIRGKSSTVNIIEKIVLQ